MEETKGVVLLLFVVQRVLEAQNFWILSDLLEIQAVPGGATCQVSIHGVSGRLLGPTQTQTQRMSPVWLCPWGSHQHPGCAMHSKQGSVKVPAVE